MKLIFIGSLSNISASGRQRLWALEQNNIVIKTINKDSYKKGKWVNRFIKLFGLTTLLINKKLENDVLECCEKIAPDIIWYEWPREISVGFLLKLKKTNSNPLLISFQDDNPWGKRNNDVWMWQNYFKNISYFDYHLVKRESDIKNIKLLGGKQCYLWQHGMYAPLFNTLEQKSNYKYPVSFVGTCMDNRDTIIEFLLVNDIDIHIFGNKWKERTDLPKRFPKNFHPPVEGPKYAQVIKDSQICLGLVSHSNIDEWTMRSYEVPACATLLIAEYTATHKYMFEALSHNVLFRSKEECLFLITKFLTNCNLTTAVAKEMNKRFKDNNWTLENRMACFLDSINELKQGNEY